MINAVSGEEKLCLEWTLTRLIKTWELLHFQSKLEKSSYEVENVGDDRPIDPASERSTFRPRI
jgi:hypothetical protein